MSASHTFTVLSCAAADDAFAVGAERHAADIACVSLEGENFGALVRVPHLHRLVPTLPLTMRLPSGLNATLVTSAVCPLRASVSVPLSASHTFTVLSQLP